MAKRSVKRERQRAQQQPRSRQAANGKPPPKPAAARARARRRGLQLPRIQGFWLGVVVAAALLVPAGALAAVLVSRGDEAPRAAAPDPVESEAERLRRQTQVRDREQVQDLTEHMRLTADELRSVVSGLAQTFPPGADGRTGPLVEASEVEAWRRLVREADRHFENPPSGETGTNVARGGFAAAVDSLLGAAETYRLALRNRGARRELLERSRQQRDVAVRTWSVAATQLDAINIATGFGHQHVYLGGTEEAGGFGADPAPEGSGSDPHAGD
jgi:hypothetical protein